MGHFPLKPTEATKCDVLNATISSSIFKYYTISFAFLTTVLVSRRRLDLVNEKLLDIQINTSTNKFVMLNRFKQSDNKIFYRF